MNTTINSLHQSAAFKVVEVYNGTEPIETLSQVFAPNVQAQHVLVSNSIQNHSGWCEALKITNKRVCTKGVISLLRPKISQGTLN